MKTGPWEERCQDEHLQAYLGAWNSHDLEAILGHHTADSVFVNHGGGECAIGHEAIRRMVARLFAVFPDIQFAIRRSCAHPGLAVQEWTAWATHLRPVPTRTGVFLPTGRTLTWDGVDIMPLAGRLIVRKDAYPDLHGLRRQLETFGKAKV